MGIPKAELEFRGETFLTIQEKKLRALGIRDIVVADEPGRGPLTGICQGMRLAKEKTCLIVPVDCPLVPESVLTELLAAHRPGITVLEAPDGIQPLIGLYDVSLLADAEAILSSDRVAPRRLFERCDVDTIAYRGNPARIRGVNTPEEYRELLSCE